MRWLYVRALRLLPAAVREDYARDMEQMFARRLAETSGAARGRLVLREVGSVVRFAVRERTWGPRPRRSLREPERRGDVLVENFRSAWRTLRRSPGFTVLAVLILGLGIGMTTAIYSALDAVLLRPSPYSAPSELVSVERPMEEGGTVRVPWGHDQYMLVRERGGPFSEVAAYDPAALTLTGWGEPVRVSAEYVSDNYLSMLGVEPAFGRTLPSRSTAAEERLVLISDAAWRSHFRGQNMLGGQITLNGKTVTVAGVMPRGFRGESGEAEFWIPLELAPDLTGNASLMQPWQMWLSVIARLRADVTPQLAAEQLAVIAHGIEAEGEHLLTAGDVPLTVTPLHGSRVEPAFRRALLLVFITAALVMLVVCLNISSLLLVRTQERQRELAIRGALGATRNRLAGLLVTESVLLSIAGGIVGVAIAYWMLNVLTALRPDPTPGFWAGYARALDFYDFRLDARVLAFTLSLTLAAGVLCGLLPALRVRMNDLAGRMGGGARSTGTPQTLRSRAVIVTAEITLAFVLVATASLVLTSLARMQREEMGFDGTSVTTMALQLPSSTHTLKQAGEFYTQLVRNVEALPGVTSASISTALPVTGANWDTDFVPVERESERFEPVDMQVVSPGHFATLGIELRSGRMFTDADATGPVPVIVSAAAAQLYWPGENPVGRRAYAEVATRSENPVEVVGVVADVQYGGVGEEMVPMIYMPLARVPQRTAFVNVRTRGDVDGIAAALRAEVRRLDPNLAITEIRTMRERLTAATSRTRFSAVLVGTFAGVAAFLALLGVYGLVAYSVRARSREIGVRLALGGQPGSVMRLVMSDVSRLAALGVLLGLAGSLAAARLVQSQLYGVEASDPRLLTLAAVTMFGAAVTAAWVPARRVLHISASAELMRQ